MPVGTQATVKALTPEQVRGLGAEIILGNTYHLYLRPGHRLIADLGGLHRFMNWHGPILTDSGGFQIYSLGGLRKIDEEGAIFQSHIDGSSHFLGPESAVEIQEALGSDIMMCLMNASPTLPTGGSRKGAWQDRPLGIALQEEPGNGRQALFGIIQGGVYPDLRRRGWKRSHRSVSTVMPSADSVSVNPRTLCWKTSPRRRRCSPKTGLAT